MKEPDSFLKDIIEEIKIYTVSIVLFGSAVKGRWIKGESDVDIFIITKGNRKKALEARLKRIFLILDKRHGLKLSETCFGYGLNPVNRVALFLENLLLYRMPYYIFSEEEVDNVNLKINNWKVSFLSFIGGSENLFWADIKRHGKVLYGKDILKSIETPEISGHEKFVQLFLYFLLGVALVPISLSQARHQLRKILKLNKEWNY